MTDHTGRVITTEVITSLLTVAWPQSVTPVNIMAGFKKCGVYPLNPGEVTDCQIAPSKAVRLMEKSDSVSMSSLESQKHVSHDIDPDRESLFQKCYQEGYDLDDEEYATWLRRRHHPESENIKSLSHMTGDVSSTCSGDSHQNSNASSKYMYINIFDHAHLNKYACM